MSELTSRIVIQLDGAQTVQDLDAFVWMAGDLLRKADSDNYHSGFEEIDRETVTVAEGKAIEDALLRALSRSAEPRFVSAVLSALSCSRNRSLLPLWTEQLAKYLESLKAANGIVYTALMALADLGEPTFPDNPSARSLTQVERNMQRAFDYLHARGITVPW